MAAIPPADSDCKVVTSVPGDTEVNDGSYELINVCPTVWWRLILLHKRDNINLPIELLPDIFQWIAPISNPNAVVNTGRTGVGLTGGRNLQTRYFLRTRPVQPAPICPWCGEFGNHQRMRRNLRSTELGNEGFGYTDLTQE